MAANGQLVFTDVDKVTFKGVGNTSNAVIDTITGKLGVGVDSPGANLHVVGNCFVSTNFELGGTMSMGTVTVRAQHELSAITATGNVTPHTIQFSNVTTGIVTTGNVEVGGTISGNGSGLTALNATNVTTGTLDAARIPDLDAAKIATGTLAVARIPDLSAAKIATGTLAVARIPDLSAAKIATGTLAVARGGTGTTSSTGSGALVLQNAPSFTGDLNVSGKVTRTYNPGEIIEELNTVCNGRPVTVLSGTYTPTNVTGVQTSSATHTEINGSRITYNKPAGAKRIYYKFACQWEDANNGALTNFKIRVYHNGAWRDVNLSRYLHSAQYVNDGNNHGSAWVINEFVFECDASSESQHDGRFTSSKTSYEFDVTWRQHGGGTGYQSKLHVNDWWDGTTTDILHTPQLTIRAIA